MNDPLGGSTLRPPAHDAGRVPESLVAATVRAVVRLARREAPTSRVLSRRTTWLVREAMKALAQEGHTPPPGRSP